MTKKLLVLINGEPIKLPHRFHQKVGTAIAAAFERSTQRVGENGRWSIQTKHGDPLEPGDRVEYLDQVWVTLMPGPRDGGAVVDRTEEGPLAAILGAAR